MKGEGCCVGGGCEKTLGIIFLVVGLIHYVLGMVNVAFPLGMWELLFVLLGLKFLLKQ